MGVTANGMCFLGEGGDENVLELVLMVAHCKYTKTTEITFKK